MKHFNNLTPAEAELLALLAEECGECIQAIGKILRHGLKSFNPYDDTETTNRTLLSKEIGHVQAAITRLCETNVISRGDLQFSENAKLYSLNQWMHHNHDLERESL